MGFLGISWNILEILGISWQLFNILGIFEQFLAKAQSFEVWMCSFTNVHPLLSLANCDLQPALFWGLWENGVVLELHIIQVLGFLHLLLHQLHSNTISTEIFGITFDFNLCLGLLQFFSPDFFLPCICTGCFHCFGLGFSFCRSLANSAPAPNLTTQEESHLSGFLCWGVCAFRRQRPPIFDTILPQWEACFFCILFHSISIYFKKKHFNIIPQAILRHPEAGNLKILSSGLIFSNISTDSWVSLTLHSSVSFWTESHARTLTMDSGWITQAGLRELHLNALPTPSMTTLRTATQWFIGAELVARRGFLTETQTDITIPTTLLRAELFMPPGSKAMTISPDLRQRMKKIEPTGQAGTWRNKKLWEFTEHYRKLMKITIKRPEKECIKQNEVLQTVR